MPSHISVYNSQRDLPLSKVKMRKVISFLLENLKISTDEVSFYFVDETAICKLHKDFFNDPSSTDCITLPMDSPAETGKSDYHILGEAFICPKTAVTYAKKHKIDPLEEVYRYVIHCLLHLIGYTDTSVTERARMKRKEGSCLKKLLKVFDAKPLCIKLKKKPQKLA